MGEVDTPSRRFGARYREEVLLSDGTRVLLRPLGPDDASRLNAHFLHLSYDSRYRRFLGAKTVLSDSELHFLTHPDGETHYALIAVRTDRPDEPLGVARFIRDPHVPDVAEPALAIVDPMQAQGLGRILVMRLGEAARERGIKRFRWLMLSENIAVRRLVRELARDFHLQQVDSSVVIDAAIPPAD